LFKAAAGGTGLTTTDANFVDLVGYGTASSANYEGSSAAPSPATAYQSIARSAGVDTNNNGADFALQTTRSPQNLGACAPACAGKQCGSDGCGGTCGTCASGKVCDATSQCIAACTPACAGKQCGGDGCGGTCGTCGAGTSCNASGQCISPGKLVINEVSTRGATASDELIELFNGSGADVNLSGYKLYYRAAATTTGFGSTLITFGSGTVIPAGKHLLVASNGYTGTVAGDATYTAGLADSGSVWLFKAAAGGTGLTTTDANFVDLVGYGTAASANFEGSSAAPSPAAAYQSVERKSGVDTNSNGADFTLQTTRTPQNLASP